jgi:hypothetical protein
MGQAFIVHLTLRAVIWKTGFFSIMRASPLSFLLYCIVNQILTLPIVLSLHHLLLATYGVPYNLDPLSLLAFNALQ